MKVVIAAGGTSGHINPALSLADTIKKHEPDAEILFIGTANSLEEKLVPKAGYEFKIIDMIGFSRSLSLNGIKRNISAAWKMLNSTKRAKVILKGFAPNVVVGFGGYVSAPVLQAAVKLSIPTAIHEQNAFPGKANQMLAKKVDQVMLTVREAGERLKPKHLCEVTGIPTRHILLETTKEEARAKLGLDERPLVLSMGGSLGAQKVNTAVADMIIQRLDKKDCYYLHATGASGDWMLDYLKEKGVDVENTPELDIRSYIYDMEIALPACDLVISRAGASSLSEIELLGKASILIPSPNVTENHQYHNAMALVDTDAAEMIEEENLDGHSLALAVDKLLADETLRTEMGEKAKTLAVPDANERMYQIIKNLAQ